MPSRSLPARTCQHARRVWPLVVVPLVVTLLDYGRLTALLANTDRVFSVTFGLPRAVSSLWSFVNAQPDGVSVEPSAFGGFGSFLVAAVVSAVVGGLLAAGYLGSIDAALDGDYDFRRATRRYAPRLIAYALLETGVGLLLFVPAMAARALLPVVAIGLFALAYLFFATPYLVVIEDSPLLAALRQAGALAVGEARVLAFFLAYLLVSAGLSLPISWVAFRQPPTGVGLAVVLAAPLALLLNVATLLFVRDLVDAGSPTPAVRRVDA